MRWGVRPPTRKSIERRSFLALAGAALAGGAVCPNLVRAQGALPRCGFLSTRAPDEAAGHTAGFLRGLGDEGFVDRETVTLDYRWARGNYAQLGALARELLADQPKVLAAGGDPAALALRAATATVPIAFLIGDDPVRIGLVESLNRPGRNATGVSLITSALGAKRLEILARLVPAARKIALLLNAANPNAGEHAREVLAEANGLKREIVLVEARAAAALPDVLREAKQRGAAALIVQNDPFFDTQRDRIVRLTEEHALPAIFHIREFPLAGGLVSYGPNLASAYRELGRQAGRLLKGADAATLPVVRPNTFELVVNLRTAKALGITVPDSLLVAADDIIE